MGCTGQEKKSCFSNLKLRKVSSENIICGRVLFYNSGKSLILTSDTKCEMYNVNTGEHVRELFHCKTRIVSCHFLPNHPNKIVALTEDAAVVVYDLLENDIEHSLSLKLNAELLNSRKVPKFSVRSWSFNRQHFDQSYEWKDNIVNNASDRKFTYGVPQYIDFISNTVIWATWSLNDEFHSHISAFFLKNGNQIERVRIPLIHLRKCYKNFAVSKTPDNCIVLVCLGTNFVVVYQYSVNTLMSCQSFLNVLSNKVEVTCLSFHPKECCFATADSRNQILIWRNILSNNPLKESLVWHTQRICDIAFSNHGVHLFSGGDENVLVKWSLLSNQKDFLPRLSSTLCYITVAEDVSLLAISLSDNEILILDSTFQKISTVQNYVMYTTQDSEKCCSILTSDPRTSQLVLNGRQGYIQFLSHKQRCKLSYSMDVAKTNLMTGDAYLVNTQVTHAKFSRNGLWLVTAEARKDNFLKECRLKFWQYNDEKQSFVLNTNMESPHNESDILSLEMSCDELVATSGSNNEFKLWSAFDTDDSNELKSVWSFYNVGRYRHLPCNPLDFCKDGTLIAAGFGPSLTLWCTSDCSLKCSLTPPFVRDHLKFIKFGSDEYSHLIVVATDYNLTAWNIITLTIIWNVDLEVSLLVDGLLNSCMCAFSSKNNLYIFSPANASPEFVVENVSDSRIVSAHFAAHASNESCAFRLYFQNSNRELFCLKGDEEDVRDRPVADQSESYLTPFSSQITKESRGGVTKSIDRFVPSKSKVDSNYIASIMSAPNHTLPSTIRFCSDFLTSLAIFGKERVEESEKRVNKNATDEVIEVVNEEEIGDGNCDDVPEEKLWKIVEKKFV